MDPWATALFQTLLKDNSSQQGSAAVSQGELRCCDRGEEKVPMIVCVGSLSRDFRKEPPLGTVT